jgi:hypothetical protein
MASRNSWARTASERDRDRMAAPALGASGILRQALWSNQLAQRAPVPQRDAAPGAVPSEGFSAVRWRTFR